jgi:recombination protein RecA
MHSSASLRQQIESDFQHRYPSVLTPSSGTLREVAATGIATVDDLLDGGLPIGAISEITGPVSSGRTTITLAFLARRIREGSVCALIDANDAFDPESAAANGVSLNHLLWVRCRDSLFEKPSTAVCFTSSHIRQDKEKPWPRLDKAIRATDLLLQSGGFAAIVLDLAEESIDHGRRIPLATWFRFRQAADRTRCSLIVLGKGAYAQSSAAVVLECQPDNIDVATGTVIRNFKYSARRGRVRFSSLTNIDRKPPATTWTTPATWNPNKRA